MGWIWGGLVMLAAGAFIYLTGASSRAELQRTRHNGGRTFSAHQVKWALLGYLLPAIGAVFILGGLISLVAD